MSKPTDPPSKEPVLDDEALQLLSSTLKPIDPPPERARRMRAQVLANIAQENAAGRGGFLTIHANEGPWVELAPNIAKKRLHVDYTTGIESYLLRLLPGAEAPAHEHLQDEVCVMLEGEMTIGEITLQAGDYHRAAKGSQHALVRSEIGALIFIQSALEEHAG